MNAYLFDMDGVLIDSEMLWVDTTIEIMAEEHVPLDRTEAIRYVYGRAWQDILPCMEKLLPSPVPAVELQERMTTRFTSLLKSRDIRIPTSLALLRRLSKSFPVAIVSGSNRPDLDNALRITGIGPEVRFTLSSDDYAPGKPDPACYRKAATLLKLQPSACATFEDSEAGVKAAKAAGMYCVALLRPGLPTQDLSVADRIVADLSQFDLHSA